jgi:putative component of toxin-antitoxin plasmid stabilization module
MAEQRRTLSIYLAGPVTNCNEKQKTEWRKAIKAKVAGLGHQCIDPTDPNHTDWTPLKETVEIDRSDVVIANLWRLSVGTVVGIVQARRKGKPVILIDPNYLESPLLRHLVGKEFIVNGIDQAVNTLPRIMEELSKVVMVRKGSGNLELFSSSKLHNSLNGVCAHAHIDDAILPDLVAQSVERGVMKAERNGEIQTGKIKLLVFDTLSEIATDSLYERELKQRALALRKAWEEYERVKKDQRWALQHMEELEGQLREADAKIQTLEAVIESNKAELDECRRTIRQLECTPHSLATANDMPTDDLLKDYMNYFPNITFVDAVLRWMLSCDKNVRRAIEAKFRLMNQERLEGKHEVPGTSPLVWQHDAGHGLRIYFRQDSNSRTTVVRIGTKGTQDSDYSKLKKGAAR